ncbi:MAG: MFS transporter [Tepidiforma sp.]|nr:MFS transporter [Tepidiforma sp.]GIW18985.1 MAG: MFS transporter [Tepidiforma sp.]
MADAAPGALAGRRVRRPARVFYGWWVVAVGGALQALQAALLGQAYGAYVVLLRDEFGWSKTLLSAASSLREAESGILGPVHGTLLDRFGPRKIASAGVVILGIGFMLFSRVQDPLQFYGAFLVMSVGASMSGYFTATFAAVHWFERRRATAISLTSAGFAVGGMCVPLTVLALESLGWRTTAFLSGVLIIAAGLPLAQLYRHHPHDLGLEPDGAPPARPARDPADPPLGMPASRDFTLGEALRTPAFWLIAFGHASALFVVSSMAVHLVSHLREALGYTLGQASAVVLALTFTFMVGNLTGGFIGDRVNKRAFLVACMAMHCTGLLILSHAVATWMVAAFVVIHGLAWGWRGPQMSAIRADYFGRAAFGKIMGVSAMVIITGTVFGPLIAGALYDRTGNYRLGFDVLALIALSGSIFFLLARRPSPPLDRQHGR